MAPVVASVAVTPGTLALTEGEQAPATAAALDRAGAAVAGRGVQWRVADTAIAGVDAAGAVTARRAGSTTLTATVDGVTGAAAVTVGRAPVATVRATVAPWRVLVVGDTMQLVSVVADARGRTLADRAVTYSSTAPGIATVSAAGLVTTVGAGQATVTASAEGRSGDVVIVVRHVPVARMELTVDRKSLLVGESTRASVVIRDSAGAVITGRAVPITTRDSGIVTVSADGVVTAVAAGSATIEAWVEGYSVGVGVAVLPPPVAAVEVTLNSSRLTVGEVTRAVATARAADGSVLEGRLVRYSTNNSQATTIDDRGVVRALAPGTADIGATVDGRTATALLTVLPAPVASVTLTLPTSALVENDVAQAVVTARDAAGHVLSYRPVSYATSDPAVATISADGQVRAVAGGPATLTATVDGRSGSLPVTVTPGAVATVWVDLGAPGAQLLEGESSQARVFVTDSQGRFLVGRPATWSSSEPAVASVSAAGRIQAVSGGSTSIGATVGGKSGSGVLAVRPRVDTVPPRLVSIGFSPSAFAVTGPSTVVTATMRMTDVGNGVDTYGTAVQLTGPGGVTVQCGSTAFVGGTLHDGTYSCPLSFPAGAAPGAYVFTRWRGRDLSGNVREVTGADAAALSPGVVVQP